MTLKLSEMEARFADYDGVGPFDICSVGDLVDLVDWAKRAREALQKQLARKQYSLKCWESAYAPMKDTKDILARLRQDIAELEQLLGEVEE